MRCSGNEGRLRCQTSHFCASCMVQSTWHMPESRHELLHVCRAHVSRYVNMLCAMYTATTSQARESRLYVRRCRPMTRPPQRWRTRDHSSTSLHPPLANVFKHRAFLLPLQPISGLRRDSLEPESTHTWPTVQLLSTDYRDHGQPAFSETGGGFCGLCQCLPNT